MGGSSSQKCLKTYYTVVTLLRIAWEDQINFRVFWFGFSFGNPNPSPSFGTDDDDGTC